MSEKRKQPSVRLGLHVKSTTDHDYFKVLAYPVTIGPNAWEIRCRDDGSYTYPDITHSTSRNTGSDKVNGLYLDCFRVTSQGNHSDDHRHLYGWECRYQEPYAVDLRQAEGMYKTLTTIEKRLEKLAEKYGRPTTFGQYLARVADAIGADCFLFINGKETG